MNKTMNKNKAYADWRNWIIAMLAEFAYLQILYLVVIQNGWTEQLTNFTFLDGINFFIFVIPISILLGLVPINIFKWCFTKDYKKYKFDWCGLAVWEKGEKN